ncbi:MAG: hypothetical protein JSV72_02200, partial [Ralstonia sp.]
MSRSSTEALAIGLGASALALGRRRSAQARFAERLHAALGARGVPGLPGPAQAAPEEAAAEAALAVAVAPEGAHAPDLTIELDSALRYSEEGALDALRLALVLLMADIVLDTSRSVLHTLTQNSGDILQSELDAMVAHARDALVREGIDETAVTFSGWVDARYRGQS